MKVVWMNQLLNFENRLFVDEVKPLNETRCVYAVSREILPRGDVAKVDIVFPTYMEAKLTFMAQLPPEAIAKVSVIETQRTPRGCYFLVEYILPSQKRTPQGLFTNTIFLKGYDTPPETELVNKIKTSDPARWWKVNKKLDRALAYRVEKMMAKIVYDKKPTAFHRSVLDGNKYSLKPEKAKVFHVPNYGGFAVIKRLVPVKGKQPWSVTEITSGFNTIYSWKRADGPRDLIEMFVRANWGAEFIRNKIEQSVNQVKNNMNKGATK